MNDFDCGSRPATLAEVRAQKRKAEIVAAARRRQFAAHADQAIGVVTSVGETDQGLTAEVKIAATLPMSFEFERNTVSFLADPSFGFRVEPDYTRRAPLQLKPSRRARLRARVKRARLKLAGRIGGEDLHENCY